MAVRKEKQLQEFTADDKQSKIPEPIGTSAHANRGADQSATDDGPNPPSKVKALSNAMSALAQFSTQEISDFLQNIGQGNPHSKRSLDKAGTLDGVVSPTTVKPVTSEDVAEIFDGIDLTESQKEAAFDLFESAINLRITPEVARLEETFEENLTEAVEEIRAELVENTDKYLSYVAEQWADKNKVGIESSLRVQMAESFMTKLADLFAEHRIELPEAVDVMEDLEARLNEANQRLVEATAVISEQAEIILEFEVTDRFISMTEGLVLTQVEKLRDLAENLQYETADEFESKFAVLRDALTESKVGSKNDADVLAEEFLGDETVETKDKSRPVSVYAAAISRQAKAMN